MSDFYVLEDGIPVPPEGHTYPLNHKAHYPFAAMQPGQSFLAPFEKSESLAARCSQVARTRGWKMTMRKVPEGVRIWRLA